MRNSELNYRELRAALESRGWSFGDLGQWLQLVGHPVSKETLEEWASSEGREAGGAVPRWPVLLMNGLLGSRAFPKLRYFLPGEFGNWLDWMHPALLYALDAARHALNVPLKISTANGALGRHMGNAHSMHNVDKLGYCFAADLILPVGFPLGDAFDLVRRAGVVSGLGIYPDWNQGPGLHLDVRHLSGWNQTPGATVKQPATWSAVRGAAGGQVYHSAAFALARSSV